MTPDEVNAALNDASAPNTPLPIPGTSFTGTRPLVNSQQARERRASMSAAMMQGASRDAIMATFTVKFNMSEDAVAGLMREVAQVWAEEDADAVRTSRGAARRRIMGHIHSASKAGRWTAVASLEKVLSEVEGTVAPEHADQGGDDQHIRMLEAVMAQMSLTDPMQMRILIDRERVLIETGKPETDLRPKSILVGHVSE